MPIKLIAEIKAFFETNDVPTQSNFVDLIDSSYNGLPMNVGAFLGTASVFVNDSDAGFYWSFDSTSDDKVQGNIPVGAANIAYTGGDLILRIKGRKSIAGNGTVGLIVSYAFIKDGDNSATEVTIIAQQNIIVDGETANVRFTTDLGLMTGEAGADTLLIGIERNSTGASADSYGGNFEMTDLWLDYAP